MPFGTEKKIIFHWLSRTQTGGIYFYSGIYFKPSNPEALNLSITDPSGKIKIYAFQPARVVLMISVACIGVNSHDSLLDWGIYFRVYFKKKCPSTTISHQYIYIYFK